MFVTSNALQNKRFPDNKSYLPAQFGQKQEIINSNFFKQFSQNVFTMLYIDMIKQQKHDIC